MFPISSSYTLLDNLLIRKNPLIVTGSTISPVYHMGSISLLLNSLEKVTTQPARLNEVNITLTKLT